METNYKIDEQTIPPQIYSQIITNLKNEAFVSNASSEVNKWIALFEKELKKTLRCSNCIDKPEGTVFICICGREDFVPSGVENGK